jgi:hypothetical protein
MKVGKIKHPFHIVGNCQDFGEFLDLKKLAFFPRFFFCKMIKEFVTKKIIDYERHFVLFSIVIHITNS